MALMNYVYAYLTSREAEEGQGMVEYGLIIALVAVVAAATLVLLGPQVAAIFTEIGASL